LAAASKKAWRSWRAWWFKKQLRVLKTKAAVQCPMDGCQTYQSENEI
jgi:hypothetical protein